MYKHGHSLAPGLEQEVEEGHTKGREGDLYIATVNRLSNGGYPSLPTKGKHYKIVVTLDMNVFAD